MEKLSEVLMSHKEYTFNDVETYRCGVKFSSGVSFKNEAPDELRLAELNRVLHMIYVKLYGEIIDNLNEAIDIAAVSGEANSHEQMHKIRKMIAGYKGVVEQLPEIMKQK